MARKAPGQVRPPWSPLSVTLIALFLPAGGAILTARNLHRLRELDSRQTRQLSIAIVVVFALGLSLLLALAGRAPDGTPRVDPNAPAFLGIGVALASYVAQRAPFARWRAEHRLEGTSSWLAALGSAVLYTLITVAAFFPGYLLLYVLLSLVHLR